MSKHSSEESQSKAITCTWSNENNKNWSTSNGIICKDWCRKLNALINFSDSTTNANKLIFLIKIFSSNNSKSLNLIFQKKSLIPYKQYTKQKKISSSSFNKVKIK
jgi:hypothetical protein